MDTNIMASSNIGTIIIMVVLVLAVIGLFVWSSISNKKKKKEAEETVKKLKIGDRVKTIGGVCGFIAELNDKENTFVLKTGMEGSWSFVKFDKAAIYQTAPADAGPKPENKADETKKNAKNKTDKKVEAQPETKEEVPVENAEPIKEEVKAEEVQVTEENK